MLTFSSPSDLPDPGIKLESPELQADSLLSEPHPHDRRECLPHPQLQPQWLTPISAPGTCTCIIYIYVRPKYFDAYNCSGNLF